ncbi:MAG: extracellular solute-binding protein [Clostridia bacterium]|nr:extracellular solute-binding protein [Clostridia bacterium]
MDSPNKYQKPSGKSKYYGGNPIVIEGEKAEIKSNYFLVGKSDTSSTDVTPRSPEKRFVNYIGGNWSRVGDTLIWETPELEAGYYSLGYVFRQHTVIGSKSYRTLRIDGKIPFAEAAAIGFSYDDNWQNGFFADDNGDPYCIYLSAGVHRISMAVTSGEMTEIRQMLTKSVALMGDLYVDITKITGETVDIYRDYELFKQISDMEERLGEIRASLVEAGEQLLKVTGERSGSNYSVINNMIEVIDKMLGNRFEAHRYKSYFYTNFCAVSSVLQDLRSMPLELDKLILFSPDNKDVFEDVGFVESLKFSVVRFLVSFVSDYNTISSSENERTVEVWVNWGRDQAQVLSSLVERSFTPKTGIAVNIKLVNASVVQAVLSGKGPDCLLRHARSEPVNLAMRGVLYDLTAFDDYKDVLTRFMEGADTPYWYKDGLYALPDSQSFFMLFYRKDVLKKYGIEVPKTWDDFDLAAKLLMRNNMSVYLPSTAVTDVAQANAGVGSNNIFPSLLLQNGIKLYEPGGKKTNLLSADAMKVFEKWTDYYTKFKFPKSIDFYNRFRTGTTPLGISGYGLYTTLKVAAPELDGLWSFTAIPGTVREDGTVSHTSAGSGSACSIMKMSKNPELAWEFLKWWTDTETQLNYSNDLETILGPTGRVALSNVEAIKELDWDDDALNELLKAWDEVEEVPEYPGSYYVSRSIYQAYWNVINTSKSTKDMMMQYGKEADDEIARKWAQYTDR